MESQLVKDKIIKYYDQEAEKYAELYTVPRMEQEFYPANAVRMDLIVDLLRTYNAKSLLDIGCGSGGPLLHFLELGFDAYGFDFSPKMVECAREHLSKQGHDIARVSQADLENRATLPKRKFDAVVATGVFPHNLNEAAAFANLRDLMDSHGVAFVEFRNSLMSLFSINRHSVAFYWDDLMRGEQLPEHLRESARAFLSVKFDTQVLSVGKERSIEYTDILARFHNPLTLGDTLAAQQLKLKAIHYYHFHAAPPHLEKTYKREFWDASLKLERTNDWRGMFLCSAFVAEILKDNA